MKRMMIVALSLIIVLSALAVAQLSSASARAAPLSLEATDVALGIDGFENRDVVSLSVELVEVALIEQMVTVPSTTGALTEMNGQVVNISDFQLNVNQILLERGGFRTSTEDGGLSTWYINIVDNDLVLVEVAVSDRIATAIIDGGYDSDFIASAMQFVNDYAWGAYTQGQAFELWAHLFGNDGTDGQGFALIYFTIESGSGFAYVRMVNFTDYYALAGMTTLPQSFDVAMNAENVDCGRPSLLRTSASFGVNPGF